jgi:hypothetical protein
MARRSKYSQEVRERAVRMVLEQEGQYASQWEASRSRIGILSPLFHTAANYCLIGVGKGFRPPRPPNRACGSPAHGSPVDGFLIGIDAPEHGLRSG